MKERVDLKPSPPATQLSSRGLRPRTRPGGGRGVLRELLEPREDPGGQDAGGGAHQTTSPGELGDWGEGWKGPGLDGCFFFFVCWVGESKRWLVLV